MSIRWKVLLACLNLTMITVVLGMLSRTSQDEVGAAAFNLYDNAFMSMSYLRSAQNTMLLVDRDMNRNDPDLSAPVDRLDSARTDLEVARDRALSPQGREAASRLLQDVRQVLDELRAGTALDRQFLSDLEDRFDDAVEINAGDGFRSRRATGMLVSRAKTQSLVVIGISVVLALAITSMLSRAIVPSVRYAAGIASDIAAGRLDTPIRLMGSGETAVLLKALGIMQRSLADKIARIEELMAEQASTHASEIARQLDRFEHALDNMVQGLCMLDERGSILVHNRRFGEMFKAVEPGAALSMALPASLLQPAGHADGAPQPRSYSRTLEDQRTIAVAERPMSAGGWVVTYEDVTERHRNEALMAHMARHDALTGLPNRFLYRERMETALAQLQPDDGLAVLCLDLDRFKSINDTLGHPVGDELLRAVAQRLLDQVAETDMVVRLGGDEFAVIQVAPSQPTEAKRLAERILLALAETFEIGDHRIATGTSVGIAVTTDPTTTASGMLKSADLALYRSKSEGRGTYRFFEAEMDARMQARRLIETDLRRAVSENEFEVFYQPIVAADTRAVSGFEALVRWRHPTRGMISPAEFIPVAEETGLIAAIGGIVLKRACLDATSWPDGVKVAVNLSPLQFRNRGLAGDVADALRRSGLAATRLELEITESLLIQDSETVLAILHEIRALGVSISMDDFGTGYSSLSYLRRFPFDKIKIDQSFVRGLEDEGDCLAIIRAVLGLGRSLDMRVIAEGVETEEQYSLLRSEGCEQLQGYLFSRPQPLSAITRMFTDSPPPAARPVSAEEARAVCTERATPAGMIARRRVPAGSQVV